MKNKITVILILSLLHLPLWGDFFTRAIAEDLKNEELGIQSIAVSSVTMISGEENEICRLYTERLTADLVQHTAYMIVDRRNVERVLSEMELSLSDMSSKDNDLELGRILNAEGLICLTIAELEEGTEIIASLTEVQTAKILYSRSFRDFSCDPSTHSVDRDIEKNLRGIEFGEKDFIEPKPEGTQKSTAILHPSDEELRHKISLAYRKEHALELSNNNKLLALRERHPILFRAWVAAYRRLAYISRDKEMLILFVFSSQKITDYLKKKYPLRTRQLYNRYLEIKKRSPRKEKAVVLYLTRFRSIIRVDKNLHRYMIRMAEYSIQRMAIR